ncbi:pirin family protein [Herbihabitans rhizosphaerae]|nr:pirin family protein [Herbihabitans rhizosphaerae]
MQVRPQETVCNATATADPVHEVLEPREVQLGPRTIMVDRLLPHRDRRMIGAWCFLDSYGPLSVRGGPGMRVPPHPHIGLQTVTWLVSGEVLHADSVGSRQLVRPGELSLMTAGRGIAHAEESPAAPPPELHGVQLWVALPNESRDVPPSFSHHADLPVVRDGGAEITVIVGSVGDARSTARMFSPIVGAQIDLAAGASVRLPLDPAFEHGALVLRGSSTVDGEGLVAGPLLYLGTGRTEVELAADEPAVVLLLGGEPFAEELVMWWNFVARDHDEIVRVHEEWERGDERFGDVPDHDERLPAPPLPTTRLRARPRAR